MKELIVRCISGALYISIIIFCLFTSREWFMVLMLILGLLTLNEFLKVIRLKSILAFILLPLFLYFLSYEVLEVNALYLLLIMNIFVNLFLLKDLLWTSRIPMFEKKKYIVVIFYLISGFVFLTLIPSNGRQFIPEIIAGVFILIWCNDTFAYLIGKNFGKRKLMERISPKKTVEGFVGGLTGALVGGFIIFKFLEIYPLWMWLVIALIAAVFGTVGDLIQSKFKRQAGVKDSGVLMPGHGGLYDRLDSIIYVSPIIYAFITVCDYVS